MTSSGGSVDAYSIACPHVAWASVGMIRSGSGRPEGQKSHDGVADDDGDWDGADDVVGM